MGSNYRASLFPLFEDIFSYQDEQDRKEAEYKMKPFYIFSVTVLELHGTSSILELYQDFIFWK